MEIVALILPLLAGITAWSIDRVVPTRQIGFLAIGSLLISALMLVISAVVNGMPLELLPFDWMRIDGFVTSLSLRFDAFTWVVGVMLLLGSAAGMIGLIHSLPYQLRNYGRLLALLLFHVTMILVGVAAQDATLRVFAWGLAAMFGGVIMRLSGALPGSDTPLISIVGGIAGAILLLVAIMWREYVPVGPLPGALIVCWSLAAFLGMGLAPFHGYVAGMSSAPAILAIFLVPLGIPLLGALTFIDMMATQGPLISEFWRTVLIIAAIVSALGTAVGAIGSTRLRSLYGWHSSSVLAVVVLAAVSDLQILAYGVPVLLVTAMFSLCVIALGIAVIETRNYTDDLLKLRPRARVGFAGVLLFIAVAASIGLPGTVGFITRWWMAEVLMIEAPWIIIAVLISGSVIGLAWAGALSTIWRRIPKGTQPDLPVISAIPSAIAMLSPVLFAAVLLITGFVPQLLWRFWLIPLQDRMVYDSVLTPPSMPGVALQLMLTGVSVLLVAVPVYASRLRQRDIANPNDVGSTSVPPVATAESLSFLSGIVSPNRLLAGIWDSLIRFGNAVQWVLRLGEERYYVAGLVLGLIVVVLLLI
ncbi:MAG: hypothetical protein ACK5S9_10930 [Roseiflexaceae bacterium]